MGWRRADAAGLEVKVRQANEIESIVGDAGGSPVSQGAAVHVVHGVLSLDLGGLERVVLDLIRAGRDNGYYNSVVCLDRRGRLADTAEAMGAQVHCLGNEAERALATGRAETLFARLRPHVLHTHQIGALWHLGRAARRRQIAVVHTEHSDHARMAPGAMGKLKSRWWWHAAARQAGHFCCVSDDIARSVCRWRTVPPAKVSVVANGVDTRLYGASGRREEVRNSLGIPLDAQVAGTVGRLSEVKRQDVLIRAFARLQQSHPQLWLLLVGDGPERKALENLSVALGVSDRVRFAGYQASTHHYLSAMDLFALSSRHEGLPLALLEAWATGLPLVSSAVGGIPRAVEHGRTGLLFESGDDAALADAIARLLDQPCLRSAIAEAGRAQVQATYSLQRMAGEYASRYRAALAGS